MVEIEYSPIKNSQGVALVMVLWIIAILSVVVLEFSFSMRTEVNITRNYQEQLKLYAAAEGSLQRALAELILKQDPRFQQLKKNVKEGEAPPEYKEWVTDGREYPVPFEGVEGAVRVMGEAGCSKIGFGLEGISPRAISIIKPVNPCDIDSVNALFDFCNSLGLFVKAYLMIGFPWETEEIVREYFEWLPGIRANQVKISYFTPFPGLGTGRGSGTSS